MKSQLIVNRERKKFYVRVVDGDSQLILKEATLRSSSTKVCRSDIRSAWGVMVSFGVYDCGFLSDSKDTADGEIIMEYSQEDSEWSVHDTASASTFVRFNFDRLPEQMVKDVNG